MLKIPSSRIAEIKKKKNILEKKLNAQITIKEKFIELQAPPIEEYEASMIFDAINLGFSIETALSLLEEGMVFEKINIKNHTRRKDLGIVRGRIIGTHGKTKNTLEEISGCKIKVRDNEVGIIGSGESIPDVITAVTNVLRGSKQVNAYKYLERINTKKKRIKF